MPDYENYPRDVLEGCTNHLREKGIPQWFIDGFEVAEEASPTPWGRVRSLVYQWPIPIISEAGATYSVDVSDRIPSDLWMILQLRAAARAWLACFGERSPWELALAYEFAHLDAMQTQKWITSSKAGRKRAEKQHKELSPRDREIVFDAIQLMSSGTKIHNLVDQLAQDEAYKDPRTGKPLSNRQLRNILQRERILPAKPKK